MKQHLTAYARAGFVSLALVSPAIAQDTPRVAEVQTPSGKFLTATETKPILTATKGSWIAVREYNGQDLLYFTHLLAWRCGLYEIRYAVNGGEMQQWPMAECQIGTPAPNALPTEAQIYQTYTLKSIQTIDVEVLYDDLSTDAVSFERAAVMIP